LVSASEEFLLLRFFSRQKNGFTSFFSREKPSDKLVLVFFFFQIRVQLFRSFKITSFSVAKSLKKIAKESLETRNRCKTTQKTAKKSLENAK
jgi:hypothetical protein